MADPMKLDPGPGERLLLWRRRCHMSQAEAADYLGCCRTTYSRMEGGERPVLDHDGGVPFEPPLLPRPLPAELLYLTRRRSALTLAELAERLGVSRPTVLKWEDEVDPRLVKFWARRAK